MSGAGHAMALRAPWWVCERGGFDRFDPRSLPPSIQKYDHPGFVEDLVRDPGASLAFDAKADVWSYAVPRGEQDKPTTMRGLLSPFVLARSKIRKLYQPSHRRFYAVTVELFCEAPGLPRPGSAGDAEVGFVVRRLRTELTGSPLDEKDVKDLARAAADELFDHEFPARADEDVYPPNDPTMETAHDLTALFRFSGQDAARLAAFEAEHAELIARVGLTQVLEGWYIGADGRGNWAPVPLRPADPVPAGAEEELPMWRLPATAAGCPPARTRSLWFGVVPTYSADLDAGGRPKLDERTTYVVQCVARRPRAGCPPVVTWSGRTPPYRLAAFFDPAGTANLRTHVRLPDFAALAAHAGDGPPAGGVLFERPAGSQLPSGPLGRIPGPRSGTPGGDSAETCGYAIELITIVATFVLSLFMPIVIFAFQLWWMLLLKFCWPPSREAVDLLAALADRPIDGMTDDEKRSLGGLFGIADDRTADLFEPDAAAVKADKALGADLVGALQPENPPAVPPGEALPAVTDPVCGGVS